jgi:hypothetical protein
MNKELAVKIIVNMILKGSVMGLYSDGEIFAFNTAIAKLQENEHSQNKGQHSDASPKEVTTN